MTTITHLLRGAVLVLACAHAGAALAQSTNPYFDDTDVFFNQFQAPSVTADPNILFILDTGSTMNEKLGGTTDPNAPTRIWVMKNSLLTVLQDLVNRNVQVNVGLMRMGVNGQSGNSGAAKGGFVVRPVQRLTQSVVDDWRRVLCMNNRELALPVVTTGCEVIGKNGSTSPTGAVPIFATPQQAEMGSAASPITEMLAEARLYFEGETPQWGQNAKVGPGFDFPQNVIDRPALGYAGRNCGSVRNCTILPDTNLVKVPGDCQGNSNSCKYNSPAKAGCQSNFIIMLSNGVFSVDTNNDNSAPNRITRWNGFLPYVGENTTNAGATSCSNNPYTTVYDAAFISGGKKISVCPDDATFNMRQVAFDYTAIDYSNPSLPNGRSVSGRTNVVTYVVGFDLSSSLGNNAQGTASARTHLETIARAGGTEVLTPNNEADLTSAFSGIIQEIVISNASFSSPSVAVNAFNQLQNLNELYFAVFSPRASTRWTGNVKKYKLDPLTGSILDANNQNAVQNGFFRGSAQSLWSVSRNALAMPDGFNAASGGAASRLPSVSSAITDRKVLTNSNGGTGTLASLASLKTATSVTNKLGSSVTPDQLLGTTCTPAAPSGAFTPAPADPVCPTRDQLIDWAYGRDVACQVLPNNLNPPVTVRNPNGTNTTYPTACNPTQTRWDMGDPLHGKPAVVTYRATSTTNTTTGAITRTLEQYLFVVTNDGYLHAIDTETGQEKWSFMPWDLVDRLMLLYKDDPINPRRNLGLDSPVKVLRIDRNNDNFIDPSTRATNLNDLSTGDHVYLYFGMRRGGRNIYAVDVTDIDNPRLVWRISPEGTDSAVSGVSKVATDFATLGQTWSSPQVTRIRVPGKTSSINPSNFALVFGGGYDSQSQDGVSPKGYVQDTMGNGIYIVDAASGRLLWRAGRDSGADMRFASNCPGSGSSSGNCMANAIPGDVRVVALSSLDAADLIYAADLGGRIWRFQVNKNATQFSDLMVGGGVVAYVGGASGDTNGLQPANARRFFVAPDISWITLPSGALSLNIAVGSGNRELPTKDTVTIDRFYSMREPYPINWGSTALTDTDFYDLRNAPTNTTPLSYPGWKLTLFQSGDAQNGAGAKVLAEARTFENTLFFTSFVPIPNPLIASDICTQQLGINNLYQVNVFDGSSKVYNPRNLPTTGDGRAVTLNQGGIAPEVQFVFPTNPVNNLGQPIGPPPKPVCLAGAESCGQFSGYDPTRTYWRQDGAD